MNISLQFCEITFRNSSIVPSINRNVVGWRCSAIHYKCCGFLWSMDTVPIFKSVLNIVTIICICVYEVFRLSSCWRWKLCNCKSHFEIYIIFTFSKNFWLLWDNRYWTYPVWSALLHLLQLWRISGCCKCICSCLHLANWNRWWSTEIVFYIDQYQIWRLSIFHCPRREYPLENNNISIHLKYP